MGMSLVFSIWIFFRVTGAAFNPNIAFTLLLLKVITPGRFVLYVLAQFLGAIAAAGVLEGLLPGSLNVNCAPGNGIGIAQALFYEMFLTFALCMTVVMVGNSIREPAVRELTDTKDRSGEEQVDTLQPDCDRVCPFRDSARWDSMCVRRVGRKYMDTDAIEAVTGAAVNT